MLATYRVTDLHKLAYCRRGSLKPNTYWFMQFKVTKASSVVNVIRGGQTQSRVLADSIFQTN
jgi:hypothetical protein